MKSLIATLALLIVVLFGLSAIPRPAILDVPEEPLPPPPQEEARSVPFESASFSISFEYPETYVPSQTIDDGDRGRSMTVALFEDTPFARAVIAGEAPGTEAPPAITISAFPNDRDAYRAETFIRGDDRSNFALSDGTLTPVRVGGVTGYAYRATGLYENENIVIARPDFVYLFSVGFLSPEDRIRADFSRVVESIRFDGVPLPVSTAPACDLRDSQVPYAVAEVRAAAAHRTDVDECDVVILSAIERDWPDTCLGLGSPEDGDQCSQEITPGYEVTVQAGSEQYTYRANRSGGMLMPVF